MTLLWLGDSNSIDVTLVGGQAANLSHLASLAHPVPDGFCLPVTVLDQAHPLDPRDDLAHALSALMACHSGLYASTAWSPDGEQRAAASASQVLQVWRPG
jgi:hypothetical protein